MIQVAKKEEQKHPQPQVSFHREARCGRSGVHKTGVVETWLLLASFRPGRVPDTQ